MENKYVVPGFLIIPGNQYTGNLNYQQALQYKPGVLDKDLIAPQMPTGRLQSSSIRKVAGSRLGTPVTRYQCDGIYCECQGDMDCNEMYTKAGCGDITKCDENGCWCLRL